MNNSLPNGLKIILSFAREEAIRLGSYSVTPDHLFLGMLRYRSCEAVKILNGCGADLQTIKRSIENLIGKNEVIPFDKAGEVDIDQEVKNIFATAVGKLVPTGVQPTSAHILVAIIASRQSVVSAVLQDNGVDINTILTTVSEAQMKAEEEASAANGAKEKESLFESYGYDLTRAAENGKLDPVIGRDEEIARLAQILCRRKKNNPVLIGESGVGKSAIVEGLAIRIASRQVPRALLDKRLVTLDMGSVVAGTKYRGQFEERIKSILAQIRKNPDIILFIDEMHTIVGAGSAPGSLDAANLLKPALARGEIQCIGATTLDEFRKIIEKDGALERRFQKITVEPATFDQTAAILEGIRGRYEEYHRVRYTDKAIKACITLSQRYISDRCLPDKAIDVLDEAGSRAHLDGFTPSDEVAGIEAGLQELRTRKREAARRGDFREAAELHESEKEQMRHVEMITGTDDEAESTQVRTVTEEDIADTVSMMTGIPVSKIASGESERLMEMDSALRKVIIGQDEAISKVVRAIRRNRAGLKDPGRPIGTFLFLGPTGVGKTQLAKKIAEYLFDSADNIIRIDMSEYTEKFTTSRLIGAPPGYVGYDEGGQLSEQVRRKPYSVVLLDEVEKAHPDIFNLLLQVLDEGRLTDSNGRTVDFRNTILILTSNVGSRELKDFGGGVGFATATSDRSSNRKSIIDKAISRTFPPEFVNRLDEQIYFNALTKEDIMKIIDIELEGLVSRMAAMGYCLKTDKAARTFIAEMGYDPKFGARPLKRAIQRYVEDPVSEAIISGSLPEGCTLKISLNKEKNDTTVKF